ncbi:MAG: DUF305 domain-containing protein [Candidatus Shapirobacteria bacterium]|nr:DUF305 domain-containing protein [Candidatus Shapirobacteria bacterium]
MWWNKISGSLVAATAVIFLTIGIGVGYWLTPEYKLSMYDKSMNLGQADRWFDLRYINGMIAHHRGAMLLAEQAAQKSQDEKIKTLAETILKDEPKAIEELYNWKKDWYGDNRKVKDPLKVNLGEYDDNFDLRFLNGLIFHHQEGVKMTKETRLKSSRAEILNNANKVEDFLNEGIKMLTEWRNEK